LFIHSEEVQKELPEESSKFVLIDETVKRILKDGYDTKNCLKFSVQDYVFKALEDVELSLKVCEKALYEFMEGKRRAFPRFYFVSTNDLLDILSNGNSPAKVMVHMPKIFQAIETLELEDDGERPKATGLLSSVGVGKVAFYEPLKLVNKVENYLQDAIDMTRETLRRIAKSSLKRFNEKPKREWMEEDPAQISLLINMVQWCITTDDALDN
jgi:dynein heavy chain